MRVLCYSLVLMLAFVQPVLSEDCDGILKNGIFDTTAIADKSFSRMVLAAELTKLTAKEARQKLGASVSVPIEGIPVGFGYTDDQFNSWTQHVKATLNVDQILQHESSVLLSQASPVIVNSWVECKKSQRGLYAFLKAQDDKKLTYTAVFTPFPFPSGSNPHMPTITSFTVTGATVQGDNSVLKPSGMIPNGGVSLSLEREGKQSVMITLNTDMGTDVDYVPEVKDLPPSPAPVTITKQGSLFMGLVPNCNAAVVTNHSGHLNCVNIPIGFSISGGDAAQTQLYLGTTPNVNAGAISTNNNFRGGATIPWGFTVKEEFKKSGSIALYVCTGACQGEVNTNPNHKNSTNTLIGWTAP